MKKVFAIALHAFPVCVMVALIPAVENDYLLAVLYLAVAGTAFAVKRSATEVLVFGLGLVCMTFFEWIFISTGVETFTRRSLFGIMPIWLPVLWGYGFVAISRSLAELKQ